MIRREKGDCDCCDGGDGKGKPLGLARLKNAPPPAMPPALQELQAALTTCRRRRRSDLLLFAIGSAIVLLSVLHLSWHTNSLPHSHRHPKAKNRMMDNSALQKKLDEFVNAREEGAKAIKRRMRKGNATAPAIKGEHSSGRHSDGKHKRKVSGAAIKKRYSDERRPDDELKKTKQNGKLKHGANVTAGWDAWKHVFNGKESDGKPKNKNNVTAMEKQNSGHRRSSGKLKQHNHNNVTTVEKKKFDKGRSGNNLKHSNRQSVKKRRSSNKLERDNSNATPVMERNANDERSGGKLRNVKKVTTTEKRNGDGGRSDGGLENENSENERSGARLPPPPNPNEGEPHPVADLNCADHGGPLDRRIVDEMVFWSDVPSDSSYLSPMHPLNDPRAPDGTERFLTFEPDSGGWNNIRMAMETALVMGHAMGRTLVLPPEQRMYLLNKGEKSFSFNDFFHLDAISIEHRGFKVITMEEFLVRVANKGELRDFKGGQVAYPPENRTSWGGGGKGNFMPLLKYLRSVGNTPEWDPWKCALAIPASTDPQAILDLSTTLKSIMDGSYGKPKPKLEEFNGNPTPVDASMAERMREMLADRSELCIYDKPLQESKLIHLKVGENVRLLTHFYAFVFFADWRQDLWSKRFVRDHLRYVDEIVCAAARVVEAVRKRARKNEGHDAGRDEGMYDAVHVRRGDFQYPPTQLPADELYALSKGELTEGATLYVATDERRKEFFDVFKEHYDVVFLDDFASEVIPDVNPNYYGMIDQLVAYKSRVFYGTWWSTLSGYVNRMRGYYIAKHKLEGYEDGTMKSWYFTPKERVKQMRTYIPVRFPIYCREFPISWRDIDKGIGEMQ